MTETQPSRDPQVLVVGAGPTGLVLALFLTKLGVRVRVVDKAAEAGTTSRAVAVQARTLEFYAQVGLASAVVDSGVKVSALNLWVGNRRVARAPIAGLGRGMSPFPFPLTYPQDEHEKLLIETLATLGVPVERSVSLAGFEQDDEHVRATLTHADGANEIVEVAYLAGCDGAHSKVREVLGTGFPGSTYSGVFYVADVDATGPATDDGIHVEIEDADFIAVFPLKGAGHLRLIGPVTWNTDRHAELTFEDVRARVVQKLGLAIQGVNWFSTYRVHHRVADRFRDARVFLLGDAAHVHSPVGGQGMNTGIGDAVNLAWKLAAVLRGSADDALLATYETERIGFARRLVATTDRAFTIVTKQGPFARFVRTWVLPVFGPIVIRIPRVRRFMFRTVSQIVVSYRDSALSVGTAGDVHAGDRLPWVELADGSDNFAPLTSLAWQVHAYGSAGDDLRAACAELHVPLHEFAWSPTMDSAGLARDAMYLVRPDGYVALAAGGDCASILLQYARAKAPLRLGIL